MKILQANAGALTNFEVLHFLKSRGAGKFGTRVIGSVAPIEFDVYDYLDQSVASNVTVEIVSEFMEKCKKYRLAKAEVLNIINIRPSSLVEIDPIVEESERRFGDGLEKLVEIVVQVLQGPATETEPDEGNGEEATTVSLEVAGRVNSLILGEER